MSRVERKRLRAAGVELALTLRRGSAGVADARPWVLILHGFTGSAQTMAGVAETLGEDWHSLCVDLPGHGGSEAPREPEAYRLEACLAQLDALLGELAIEDFHLVGYSMGGRVALGLCAARAAARARLPRSLLLVGASPGLAEPRARAERVAADEALARRILDEGLEAFVDHWMALPLFASQKRLGEDALAAARAERLQNRPEGLAASLRGLGTGRQPALHAALPDLSLPVCLVVGDEDAKFSAIAQEMAAALPDARIERIREAGHAAHLEQPQAFARVLRGFLSRVDGGVRGGEGVHDGDTMSDGGDGRTIGAGDGVIGGRGECR